MIDCLFLICQVIIYGISEEEDEAPENILVLTNQIEFFLMIISYIYMIGVLTLFFAIH